MNKILMLLLMTGAAFAQTTQIYTGTIKDLTQQVVTSGQVTFTLTLPNASTIPGTGVFVPTTIPCNINSDGTLSGYVSGAVSGACIVTANTSLTPTGTAYRICEQPYFSTPGSCFYDYALGGTKDISSIVPTLPTGPINYGGVPGPPLDFLGTWSSSTAYSIGQMVVSSNISYISLANQNLGNTPSSSPSSWSQVQPIPTIVPAPSGSQTITQPAGTSLLVNTTNSYNSSTYHVNGGVVADGVNLTNLFQFTNLFQNGSASLVGAMQTGSASTNVEVDGVLGVVVQNGGSPFAVGVRSTSVCQLPRSCWGANFLSTDVATTGAGSSLWGIESDTNVYNTSTIGQGIAITGYFDVQPAANMNALNIFVVPKTGTNNAWNAGIVFSPGDIAGNGPAIFLPPQLNTVSQNSQNITLQSEDSGGGINTAHFFLDSVGELDFCTFSLFTNCPRVNTTGDFVTPHQLIGQVATGTPPLIVNSTTPVANLITANQPIAFVNGSSTISTATKIFSTACTMASGTCTVAIPNVIFSNPPACTLSLVIGDAAGTAEPTLWFGSITNTSLVMRASSTAFGGNVVAVCFGQ